MSATVGSHCLDCARAARPDIKTRAKIANSQVLTPATYAIIGINLFVFAAMALADATTLAGDVTALHVRLGLGRQLLEYGGQLQLGNDVITMGAHQWYRLVTSGFIHFGLFHILMNMLLLYQLGMMIERAIGSTRFALLYFASLLAGSFGVLLLDSSGISGGASGAVFGLMAGAAIGMHRRGVNVWSTGIGTTLLLNLVLTFTIPGISIGGHLGGAVGGAVCGWVMLAPPWKRTPAWAMWAAPLGVALIAVGGAIYLAG